MPNKNTEAIDEKAEPTPTDIFQQQEKTISTLIDVLTGQGTTQPQQIIYSQAPAQKKTTPNYLAYITVAIAVWYLLRGKR